VICYQRGSLTVLRDTQLQSSCSDCPSFITFSTFGFCPPWFSVLLDRETSLLPYLLLSNLLKHSREIFHNSGKHHSRSFSLSLSNSFASPHTVPVRLSNMEDKHSSPKLEKEKKMSSSSSSSSSSVSISLHYCPFFLSLGLGYSYLDTWQIGWARGWAVSKIPTPAIRLGLHFPIHLLRQTGSGSWGFSASVIRAVCLHTGGSS